MIWRHGNKHWNDCAETKLQSYEDAITGRDKAIRN